MVMVYNPVNFVGGNRKSITIFCKSWSYPHTSPRLEDSLVDFIFMSMAPTFAKKLLEDRGHVNTGHLCLNCNTPCTR